MRYGWLAASAVSVLLASFGLVLVLGHVGCLGEDMQRCGNGRVESGEQCDCGTDPDNLPSGCTTVNGGENGGCSATCRLQEVVVTMVTVKWLINGEVSPGGGSFDTCNDVGASFVHIRLQGDTGYFAEESRVSCGGYQATFNETVEAPILPGHYTVQVTLQDAEENPVAPSVSAELAVNTGPGNAVTVDFPLDTFYEYESMRGQLGYRLAWGVEGSRCADAEPEVVTQEVALVADGTHLPGYPQDGSCVSSTVYIQDLHPGDYELHVAGYDASDTCAYFGAFPVKVGVGVQAAYPLVVPTADATGCGF